MKSIYLFITILFVFVVNIKAGVPPIGQPCNVYVDPLSKLTEGCGLQQDQGCLNIKSAISSCGDASGYVVVNLLDGLYMDKDNFNLTFINQTIVYKALNYGQVTFNLTGIDTSMVIISDVLYTGLQSIYMYSNFNMSGINVVGANYTLLSNTGIIQTMINMTQISVNVDQCSFSDNQGVNGTVFNLYSNIAVQQAAPTITITNSVFLNNHGDYGAVLYANSSNDNIYISDSTFKSNIAVGVGIVYPDTLSDVVITGSTFSQNYVQSGGVVYFNEMKNSPYITNCQFVLNIGGGIQTAAIAMVLTDGYVLNTTFTLNFNMSGLYAYRSNSVNVTNSVFTGNTIYNYNGGGVYFELSGMLLLNCIFRSNKAVYGGAIYSTTSIVYFDTPLIKNSIIENNNATVAGGGLFLNGISALDLSNVTMSNNIAVNGSNFYCLGSNVFANTTSINSSLPIGVNDNLFGIMCNSGNTCSILDSSNHAKNDPELTCNMVEPHKKDKGLTNIQKIGISIGVCIGVVFITIIIIILIKRSKKHHYHSIG